MSDHIGLHRVLEKLVHSLRPQVRNLVNLQLIFDKFWPAIWEHLSIKYLYNFLIYFVFICSVVYKYIKKNENWRVCDVFQCCVLCRPRPTNDIWRSAGTMRFWLKNFKNICWKVVMYQTRNIQTTAFNLIRRLLWWWLDERLAPRRWRQEDPGSKFQSRWRQWNVVMVFANICQHGTNRPTMIRMVHATNSSPTLCSVKSP